LTKPPRRLRNFSKAKPKPKNLQLPLVEKNRAGQRGLDKNFGGLEVNSEEFKASVGKEAPEAGLSAPLEALWWDAKGDWTRAHALVDELETKDGMAVHAYLHRKEGSDWNADYWYQRAGRKFHRPTLEAEWAALVEGLVAGG
jgi:hypothetical protein